jgi:hypothetical protein
MKPNFSSLLSGLALIAIGGLAFANQLGYLERLTPLTWALIFVISSALFFISYLLNGIHAWGWLFPACISAGLAATIATAEYSAADSWIPTLMIGSVAIPFFAAFALDRSRTWALIPAFILGFIAFIPPLDHLLTGDLMGALIVTVIGLFFVAAYLMVPKNWWAIIPGGILCSIALLIAFEKVLPNATPVTLMFLGWMLTFGLVWKRENKAWARIPVAVMGILAGITLLVSIGLEAYWALGLIVAGLILVILSLFRRAETLVN